MKIYYKDNLLFENIEEKDVEKTINDYITTIDKSYDNIYDRTLKLIDKVEKIRNRNSIETISEYFNFIEKEYPEVLKELKNIGKEFYKDSFENIFFINSNNSLVGIYVKNEKGFSTQIFLPNVLFDIAQKVPVKQFFDVTE